MQSRLSLLTGSRIRGDRVGDAPVERAVRSLRVELDLVARVAHIAGPARVERRPGCRAPRRIPIGRVVPRRHVLDEQDVHDRLVRAERDAPEPDSRICRRRQAALGGVDVEQRALHHRRVGVRVADAVDVDVDRLGLVARVLQLVHDLHRVTNLDAAARVGRGCVAGADDGLCVGLRGSGQRAGRSQCRQSGNDENHTEGAEHWCALLGR